MFSSTQSSEISHRGIVSPMKPVAGPPRVQEQYNYERVEIDKVLSSAQKLDLHIPFFMLQGMHKRIKPNRQIRH